MPPDLITGRDIELIAVGIGCLFVAGWFVFYDRAQNWHPLLLFAVLGGLSFALAWWDIRTHGGLSFPRNQ